MTSMITARVDSDKRKKAEIVFSEVGLTTSAAVNLFICAVAMNGGIPFHIGVIHNNSSGFLHKHETPHHATSGVKLGFADGKYNLPEDFDTAFDAMDADVADLFNGQSL